MPIEARVMLIWQDWFRILSDPNPSQLETMLAVGQRVTWPSLNMVKNRLTIEVSYLNILDE